MHTRSATTDRFLPKYEDREATFRRLSTEMSPFFVGPVPPQDFLDYFLPSTSCSTSEAVAKFRPEIFTPLVQSASEAEMFGNLVSSDALRTRVRLIQIFQVNSIRPYLQNLLLVNTSRMKDRIRHSKFTFSCQPDCSVYSRESEHNFELNSALIEFPIEFKLTADHDPFVVKPSPDLANENPFMRVTSPGRHVAGQITAYATSIMSAQYRTHTFLVLVFKTHARLIRWDRGGAVVTAPISYDQDPHLFDFFVRYDNASRAIRGHDCTVGLPTDVEAQNARKLADLADAKSLLTVTISDPGCSHESSRYVILPPCARPDIPVGRWTRISIAYDVRRNKRVLMKDSWRVVLQGVIPEGEIYAKLHQNKVPNIPRCSCATDVGDDILHQSRTHKFVSKYGDPFIPTQFVPHRHYRLVLDTIGRKLQDFKRSWEMVNAVHASLIGEWTDCSQFEFGGV